MKKNDSWVIVLLIGFILLLGAQIFKNEKVFAFAFPLIVFSWMWLGFAKKGKVRGAMKYGLISILLVYWLGFFWMLNYDMSKLNGIFLGLPKATAIQLLIVWLIPLFTVTILFGIRFKKDFLSDDDIREFNEKTGSNIAVEKSEDKKNELDL